MATAAATALHPPPARRTMQQRTDTGAASAITIIPARLLKCASAALALSLSTGAATAFRIAGPPAPAPSTRIRLGPSSAPSIIGRGGCFRRDREPYVSHSVDGVIGALALRREASYASSTGLFAKKKNRGADDGGGNDGGNKDGGSKKPSGKAKREDSGGGPTGKGGGGSTKKKSKEQQQQQTKGKARGGSKGKDGDGGSSSSSSSSKKKKKKGTQSKKKKDKAGGSNILELMDPYKAGKKLRRTLDTALTTLGTGLKADRPSKYYLDDRFLEPGEGPALFAERNPLFDRLDSDDKHTPEVLVVGAAGEVGRLVVRRLLLDGRFRVRVLVRDLYSRTLELLGTGVTYCQGDLGNEESLEYAVTDVDKIVFCATAPRPDEEDFRVRFGEFVEENLLDESADAQHQHHRRHGEGKIQSREDAAEAADLARPDKTDAEWNRMGDVLEVRSRLAEQVDSIGMANLIRAYQNVRHADYGTSQAAKRSLFKFQQRPEDFNLFAIDAGDDDEEDSSAFGTEGGGGEDLSGIWDEFDDEYGEQMEESPAKKTKKKDKKGAATARVQCGWVKNKFGHGVFVGQIPTGQRGGGAGGEAAVVSSRLRSREDPEGGIDLMSGGFAGFVCRVCADGGIYEMFVRTGEYAANGVEYVCEFATGTKPRRGERGSRNKFVTVRLPFGQFEPVSRREGVPAPEPPPFRGKDVRQIGFRFRSSRNDEDSSLPPALRGAQNDKKPFKKFYLSLSYIKVYRSQPEPEFVYLSDARIPPVVSNGMVRDDVRQIVPAEAIGEGADAAVRIFDEKEVARVNENVMDRTNEETYFKYRGEKMLRDSGLNYAIIRVAGFNESPIAQSSTTLRFKQTNDDIEPVSRADLAQVCVNALLDPDANNVSFYLTKAKPGDAGSSIGVSFSNLKRDS